MASSKDFKFDIPTVLLVIYVLYALFEIGMTGLLFSVSIGLILYGVVDSWAALCAGIILSGIVWKVFLSKYLVRREGFRGDVPVNSNPIEISKRIQTIQRKEEPSGFLSSSFVEGFADASSVGEKPDAGSEKAKENFETAAGSSAPASTNAPAATSELMKALPKDEPSAVPPMMKESSKPNGSAQTVQSFTNGGTQDGLFKLGSLPAESSGGLHIDAGTTLLNAMSSLKPDQIEAMTTDTRKLLDTQKSLMGMLQSMKPMLNDGKQLMETFQQMFGNQKIGF